MAPSCERTEIKWIAVRRLIVVEDEAEQVRTIFRRYLALGSIGLLIDDLHRCGVRPRTRVGRDGRHDPFPAKQFWTVTIYDVDTRSIILNKEQRAILGSRDDLVKNADGSVDLYFAPTAPKGFEKNWIQTMPGQAWFTAFRLYAPLEPYFDKSWPLPDVENLK